MSRTVVVVPCYNEARRLNLRAIQEYGRRADGAELLFVDDGSRDETLELLAHLHGNHPRRFSFLHLAKNGGKADAVRQGLLHALQTAPDYVGFWDADLATPLADIDAFVRVLDAKPHIEMVIGARMKLLGHEIDRRPLRYWLGRLFANVASLALGIRVFDTQCGAKLLRATSGLSALLAQPFCTRWIFDVELLARLKHARRGTTQPALERIVYEAPLDSWRDVAGSTVKSGDFAKAVGELANIYWTYLRPGAAGLLTPAAAGLAAGASPAASPPTQQKAA
jgi:glycosyltransferase involved in cell wall biosynthesis